MQVQNSTAPNANESQAFCNLSGEARERFSQLGTEMSYKRGDRLFSEGEMPQHLFVIRSGRIKLSVTSQEGKVMILRIAEAGEAVGLNAVLSDEEHEVSAEAAEPCKVTAIRARDFRSFLEKYPAAAMEATRCILREYQFVLSDVCRLALPATVAGRLATLLLDCAKKRPASGQENPRFIMALTQEEMAGMTGTSRETVSRVLQQFQRDKVISVKGASFTVLRPDALQQLAN